MPPMITSILSNCFLLYSATEEVKSLNEQEAVPSVEECSSVLSSCLISKNETSGTALEPIRDDGNDKESDGQILRSILNDGL